MPFEAKDGPVDVWFLEQDAGVVDQVPGGEVIGAIDNDVVIAQDFEGVLAGEPSVEFFDAKVGVDVLHAIGGGIEFLAADVAGAVDDLALQIGNIDNIEINEADASDACGCQIEAERRAQTAGADHGHFRLLQFALPSDADFRAESDGG